MDLRVAHFVAGWLKSTTCGRHSSLHWKSYDGDYVIMKHAGHTEYIDRLHGQSYCATYYALYRTEVDPGIFGKENCLKRWEGRWQDKYMDEAREIIKRGAGDGGEEQ